MEFSPEKIIIFGKSVRMNSVVNFPVVKLYLSAANQYSNEVKDLLFLFMDLLLYEEEE